MTPVALLRAARGRISTPGAWSPRLLGGVDRAGCAVGARAPEAVAWSGFSALSAVGGAPVPEAALVLLRIAVGAPWFWIWEQADGRTQAEVLAAFDRAVSRAADHRFAA